jgi:beta-N-acetylhexosaminidase
MTEHAPLILDVAGTALGPDDRRRLAHPLTGGVILFARNWENRAQLLQLTSSIKAVRDDLLICVDHEGGRVQRFRTDGFTHLPPMSAFGDMWMDDGKGAKAVAGSGALRATNAATAAGYVLGTELRACGVDFSFTPVLDLDWSDDAPQGDGAGRATHGSKRVGSASREQAPTSRSSVIGDRAFHRDPRVVALLAKSLMHGLLQAGMAHCGKHFPGHGYVKADSHTEAPVDRRSLKDILADDAAPYAWLSSTLTSVMPAHVIYPRVDSRPAGFSQRWLHDILRRQMHFDGAIFSDDLSMAGARRIDGAVVSYTDAAIAALGAGCDLVLLCNQSLGGGSTVDELLDGLTEAQARGRWQPSVDSEARRLALLPQTLPQPWDELMYQPAYRQALDLLP